MSKVIPEWGKDRPEGIPPINRLRDGDAVSTARKDRFHLDSPGEKERIISRMCEEAPEEITT